MYNIAVIGCGVVGLTSALVIQEQLKSSVNVTIYTEHLSPNTTGDVSAGLWGPFLLQETKIENILKWSKSTHDYFLELWKQGYANEAGICLQLVLRVTEHSDFDFPKWGTVPFGCQLLSKDRINKLNSQFNKSYKGGCAFVSLTFEPSKFLPYLQEKFIANGGRIKMRKITDFAQLSNYDVIVNCTGLYSKILANDDQVSPIRGQVTRVNAPWHFHTVLEEGKGNYIIPNYGTVILGGTAQFHDYDINVRECDKNNILEGCYKINPALANASIIKHAVGLRPGRPQVRLESEILKCNNKNLNIVHNYGHGGSGVTLSYGCALDVVNLVKAALPISYTSKL